LGADTPALILQNQNKENTVRLEAGLSALAA